MTDCEGKDVIELIIYKGGQLRYLNFGYHLLVADPWPKLDLKKNDGNPNNFNKWIKIEARQQKIDGQYKFQVNFSSESQLVDDAGTNYYLSVESPSPKRNLEFLLNPDHKNFKGKIKNLEFKTQVADEDRNEQNYIRFQFLTKISFSKVKITMLIPAHFVIYLR